MVLLSLANKLSTKSTASFTTIEEELAEETTKGSMWIFLWGVLDVLLTFLGFYLAFKCAKMNGGGAGTMFVNMLGACCCNIFYIAYALAMGCYKA
jgi:hypothetical protein